jgi:N-acetylglutamate synthase-like GNAT family acetyltransferase
MSLSVRKAEQNDIKALCVLMAELSDHPISPDEVVNRLQFVEESKFDSLFVCEENGQILGLLGFRIRENLEEISKYGEVSAVVVKPDERHKSLGRCMMDYTEKLAKELGCIGTWLVSGFGPEEESHDFYKQLGYQINGYRFVKLFK